MKTKHKLGIILAGLALALSMTAKPDTLGPTEFAVEGQPQASQGLLEQCSAQIEYWADKYTDTWYDHMEQCVYLDPDYLTPTIEDSYNKENQDDN